MVKYAFSIVKQVLNKQMHELPHLSLDFFTIRAGIFYAVLCFLRNFVPVLISPCVINHFTVLIISIDMDFNLRQNIQRLDFYHPLFHSTKQNLRNVGGMSLIMHY